MSAEQVENCFKKAFELVKTEIVHLPPEAISHSLIETLFVHLVEAEKKESPE